MSRTLEVKVNGERRLLKVGATVADLLKDLALPSDGIAVEVNRTILPRRCHPETQLADGDEIEVVTFVGGG